MAPLWEPISSPAWAPRAKQVYVCYENHWNPDAAGLLTMNSQGYWSGFIPGIRDGTEYKLFVVGAGRSSYKRDPYARELTSNPPDPFANCVVRDPHSYQWHDYGFRPPAFNDLII